MDLEDLSDNTEQTKTPKTRSEYLHGKTELSDVDIIHILDLPVEKRSINNEIYTDKSYKELKNNPEELSSLTENLKTKPEYLKYHSSYIAKSKLLYQESDVLCNEIPCLMVLNQLKKTSYLLPYEYASNKSGAVITSADALKSNTFTDLKRVFNSRLKKLIEKGITQGKDIFFLINNKKLSHDEIKSQLIRFLNNRTSENKEGTYLFFSEKNFVCYSFESDKNGFITELPEYDLKEIRAAISSKPLTPSRESEKTSDSLASNLNITQEKSDVNELFSSLLLRGEITLLERKNDIENRNERYLDAVTSLEKLTPLIQSDSIKESNNKFVKKQKESRFYKDVQNLFVKTKTSNKPQENKKENTSSENISYENEEMSKAAAIKERNQQKKLTKKAYKMILDQEDKEQMENISAAMKSATKDFMDLNATPITEERTMKSTENFESQEYLGTISPDEESSRRIDSGEIFGKLENQQSKEKASSLSKNYTKVAVGVAPTIQTLRTSASSTALRASTTLATEENISQVAEKSINEQKIKMPDQLVYAAAKVGQVIEQRVQNELGIVNPTRDDRLSTISIPLNKDYNEDFSLSTEKNMSETQMSINEQKTKLQIIEQEDKEQLAAIVMTARKTIKESLAQKAEPLVEVDFSKANYDRLFPRAIVQTPVETVKLGENQFEKLDARDRKRFLLATFQTLATPDLVIDEEREGKHSHNYIKSFVFDEKTKTIQDVVVNINGENVSITAHPRDINNIVNKIKMPDQLVYAAARVGQVIEQRTQEAQSIVNPTRDDRLSTISVPLNKEYNENFALSTVEKLLETEKNAQKATAADFQQIEPALQKKFDKLKAAIKSREEQDIQDISAAEEPGNKKQAIRSKSDIIRQAGKDFLKSVKEGIAPFFNAEDDFQRIIMHPQAIINASNGLPFSGESQLLAQIYHQRQRMEGEVVTSIAGAKAAGTIVLDTPESRQKNFALTDTSSLAEKNAIVRTRYFMPESCEEPDKIYAHTLQRQRPDKIRSYRDLIRHFENIPNGQKEISDIRIRIAHEHLKEIQSRFAIKEKRVLSVDEIEERKNFLRNYFERLPADYRNSERSAFEDTFGIQLNSEKNLEINLQRDFKDIDFAELKKNTKKSIELENRKLSDFIEKNTMEDKKLATLLSDEYKSLSKEEKMTVRNLKIEAIGIKEPETFLGKYLAACNTNAEFITDKETVEEVKKNLVKKLEENFKLEKYDILKEIGQQAQSIGNETTKKISFEKAHSNNKSLEKTQSPDKEISLIGMGK